MLTRRPLMEFLIGFNSETWKRRITRWFSSDSGKRFGAVWGNGDFGRLGLGNLDSQWSPVPCCSAFDREMLKDIACGGAHTLFLTGSKLPFFVVLRLGYGICSIMYLLSIWGTLCYVSSPADVESNLLCLWRCQMCTSKSSRIIPPPLAESGRVYATGLNNFGQLGISDEKSFSIVGYLILHHHYLQW